LTVDRTSTSEMSCWWGRRWCSGSLSCICVGGVERWKRAVLVAIEVRVGALHDGLIRLMIPLVEPLG
jgi:hypothetical protein